MTIEQIEEFKKLEKEKSKLVEILQKVNDNIASINNERYKKSKDCDHRYPGDMTAIEVIHPFKSCKICGEML